MIHQSAGPHGPSAVVGGDDALAWAVRVPRHPSPLTGWSVHCDSEALCIVEGDFYASPPGQPAKHGEIRGLAMEVARQLSTNPNERVTGLYGAWSGIYVDVARETAYLFGDLTGTRPIYWHASDTDFIASNSLWSFRACPGFRRRLDALTLNEWLAFGVVLGGRTLLEDVRLLRRGEQVRAHGDGRVEVVSQIQHYDRQSWTHRQAVQVLRDATDEAMISLAERCGERMGIGLSGGLDSRILLASLQSQDLPHHAITYCDQLSDRENEIASDCARLTNTPHDIFVIDEELAKQLIADCLLLNQGESRAHAVLQMAIQAAHKGLPGILIGYPADVFAGHPMGDFDPHKLKSTSELADKLLSVYHTGLQPDVLKMVLCADFQIPWDTVMTSWRDSFAGSGSLQDQYIDHVLDYRLQRRTCPRLDQSRLYCLPLFPYIDERLYSVYRQLPLAEIVEERAHIDVLSSYASGLENISSNAKAFLRLPIKYEYAARHAIHAGRLARSWLIRPARQTLREWRRRPVSSLPAPIETWFAKFAEHPIFDATGMGALAERARQGTFSTAGILQQMRCATMLYDLLIEGNFGVDHQPAVILMQSELDWIDWATWQQDRSDQRRPSDVEGANAAE